MNFVFLAHLGTYDLECSLKPRLTQFTGDSRRILSLRGPRKNSPDPDDDLAYVDAPMTAKWPEYKAILGHIRRMGEAIMGGVDFGRIQLEMLMPRAAIGWIMPADTAYAQRFERVHVVLRTNPGAMLFAGPEMLHLQSGAAAVVKNNVPNAAINWGEQPRIHLLVDVAKRSIPEPELEAETQDD